MAGDEQLESDCKFIISISADSEAVLKPPRTAAQGTLSASIRPSVTKATRHEMKQTYLILFLLVDIIATSCNQTSNSERPKPIDTLKTADTLVKNKPLVKTDTIKEEKGDNKIYELILALPEVKERANHIEEVTKGTAHLRVEITERPKDNNGKYYYVQAGMINDLRFEPQFNFLVYTKNFEIKYYDTVNDTIISLDTWRKETNASR